MPEEKKSTDSFLVRWSRRKRADRLDPAPRAAREAQHETHSPEPSDDTTIDAHSTRNMAGHEPRPAHDTETSSRPETVPDDLASIDVDTLSYESDFKRFLESDVPEALRKRALRQLWRSDPILANVDGLNDYDEDFSDAALAVKVLETAHKIGRGYLDNDDEAGTEPNDEAAEPVVADPDIPADPDIAATDDDSAPQTEVTISASDAESGETKT